MTDTPENLASSEMGVISATSVTELVYRRLQAQILAGLAAGLPLRLNEISGELGVSTTPVRMALERLAADGLVVHAGRKGARVAPLSLTDFRDIYAVRRALEGAAARLGAPRLTDTALDEMNQSLVKCDRIATSPDPEVDTYLRLEWAVHEICYRATGHQRLFKEIRAYRRQAERYFRLVLLDSSNLVEDLEHQHAFLEACLRRSPGDAEGMAHLLLDWTVERVAPLIQRASSTVEERPVRRGEGRNQRLQP
jgi:DNA-binding GntR family transcriptional regulator